MSFIFLKNFNFNFSITAESVIVFTSVNDAHNMQVCSQSDSVLSVVFLTLVLDCLSKVTGELTKMFVLLLSCVFTLYTNVTLVHFSVFLEACYRA